MAVFQMGSVLGGGRDFFIETFLHNKNNMEILNEAVIYRIQNKPVLFVI